MKRTAFIVSLAFTMVYTLLSYAIIDEIDYQLRVYNEEFLYQCGMYSNVFGITIYVWMILLCLFGFITWAYISLMRKFYKRL